MKTCPFCAETIQMAATKCRHCSEVLQPAPRAWLTLKFWNERITFMSALFVLITTSVIWSRQLTQVRQEQRTTSLLQVATLQTQQSIREWQLWKRVFTEVGQTQGIAFHDDGTPAQVQAQIEAILHQVPPAETARILRNHAREFLSLR